MDMYEFAMKLVENQGIIALVLLLMMRQNARERAALLAKNCEMSHFIMNCLERQFTETSRHNVISEQQADDVESIRKTTEVMESKKS